MKIRKIFVFYVLVGVMVSSLPWIPALTVSQAAEKENSNIRHALVIGNSQYTHADPLLTPANDTRAISSTLQQLGFEVNLITDAHQQQLEQAILEFGEQLRQHKGIGLFYYAGHGLQLHHRNYLLPTDFNPKKEEDVRYDALPLTQLLVQM